MSIIRFLLDNAQRFPRKNALILGNATMSYEECVENVRQLSGALHKLNINDSSTIGILLNNSFEFIITLLAAADIGATVAPLNYTISQKDLLSAIDTADIDVVVGQAVTLKRVLTHTSGIPIPRDRCITVGGHVGGCLDYQQILTTASKTFQLNSQPAELERDYILTMTSGSTSLPKPIVFTQGTKIRRSFSAQKSYQITHQDTVLVATPLYHSISQRLIITPLILGATCVIMRNFSPNAWLKQVDSTKVSFTIAVASQLQSILAEIKNTNKFPGSLRCVVSCCAPLSDASKKEMIEHFKCDFHECYGTSEMGVISNLSSSDPLEKVKSVGRVVSGVDIKILDSERKTLPPCNIGEISCCSAMKFSRYYKNDAATRESLENDYFCTGDMGYIDNDGYLFFSGRKKEVIITGGSNVFPKDIESVLIEHPQVRDCAVIGVADQQFGEAIIAVIIAEEQSGLNEHDLRSFVMERLANVQKPLAYVFVDEFPRTALGKTIKPELQRKLSGLDASARLRAALKQDDN